MKLTVSLFFIILAVMAMYFVNRSQNLGSLEVPQNSLVILTSFEEEMTPYLNRLEDATEIKSKFSMCSEVFTGSLYKKLVILAVTGTGKAASSICTLELLQKTDGKINEVIFSGIAGISPRKGNTKVMIGDVCINSSAIDFDSQYYSSDQGGTLVPNPSFWPYDIPNITHRTKGDANLASEIYEASGQVEWPTEEKSIQKINLLYHSTTRKPKSWGPGECIEASGDLFWHDTRSDKLARELGANWLNESLGFKVNAENILVVTAMEGAPIGAVISRWNEAHSLKVNFAYIRAASNFDQPPSSSAGIPVVSGKTSIQNRENEDGNAFGSLSASLPVLKMLELRSR